VPSFEKLKLPEVMRRITDAERGMILVNSSKR